ncbi:hypothetical protein [Sphingopyxis kveilinensis]|uniref:hypothetical protein n=1 Tax=Sphingopyxis kveilinensis TaxID=3114367 RepID=UPI0030CF6419
MQDEHFMRDWNEGHNRFSSDVTRGLGRLAAWFRSIGRWIALPSAPGEDTVFTRAAARCGIRPRRAR